MGGDRTAVVRLPARTTQVSLLVLTDPVVAGEWVVCHSGFALARVDEQEAREALALRGTAAVATAATAATSPTPASPLPATRPPVTAPTPTEGP
ncbi:MAG TPA: HypC/HybG/HupF family hydrogenase formation chaperone [Pedococcus sp.]